MRTRVEWEKLEDEFLAPYAQKSRETRGRRYKEEEHPYRSVYQRDRDRIIHSRAFRRLQYKTQVFVNHEGDHYRTRLTHSTEVAQISRIIARALRLNEDLAEAIALAHDLGHPPFGHSGEAALNILMKKHGGFEHNRQSLRIVDKLEKRYPEFDGLNLTWEVREGIMKHRTEYDKFDGEVVDPEKHPSLEAQIADIADEIAYNAHDIDDGLASGYLTEEEMEEAVLWRKARQAVDGKAKKTDPEIRRFRVVRTIINDLVTDVVENTFSLLKKHAIGHVGEARNLKEKLVAFSPAVKKEEGQLKQFLMAHLYTNYQVEIMHEKAHRILKELFTLYTRNPKTLPPTTQAKIKKEGPLPVIVCDYVAGMTDRYAINEYRRLCDLSEKFAI